MAAESPEHRKNHGGAGGEAIAGDGGSGGSGGGLYMPSGSLSDTHRDANHPGDAGATASATGGAGGIVISGTAGAAATRPC